MKFQTPPDVNPNAPKNILTWDQKDSNTRIESLKDALIDARLQIRGLQMWVSRLMMHEHKESDGKLVIGLGVQDQIPQPKIDPLK